MKPTALPTALFAMLLLSSCGGYPIIVRDLELMRSDLHALEIEETEDHLRLEFYPAHSMYLFDSMTNNFIGKREVNVQGVFGQDGIVSNRIIHYVPITRETKIVTVGKRRNVIWSSE